MTHYQINSQKRHPACNVFVQDGITPSGLITIVFGGTIVLGGCRQKGHW